MVWKSKVNSLSLRTMGFVSEHCTAVLVLGGCFGTRGLTAFTSKWKVMLPTTVVLLFSKWTFTAHPFGIYLRDEVSLVLTFNLLMWVLAEPACHTVGFPHDRATHGASCFTLHSFGDSQKLHLGASGITDSIWICYKWFDCMRSGRRAVIS